MDENASVIVSINAEPDAPEAVQFYRWLGICVSTWAFVDRLLYQILVTTMLFHSAAVICIAILAVAPLISHHHANRYWLHTGLIGLMVLLGYDLTPC